MKTKPEVSFAQAAEEPSQSFVGELVSLIRHNRKYWLVPLIAGLLGFGVIVALGSTAVAPFIYSLF